MQHRTLARASFSEHYLTVVGDDVRAEDAAEPLFEALAGAICEHGIEPIQQKVYGPSRCREEVLTARARAYARAGLDPHTPCTFTSGRLDQDEPLGAQLWGVVAAAGKEASVATVGPASGPRGRLLSAPGLRMLWLSAVDGLADDSAADTSRDTFAAQAERMFRRADEALAAHDLRYRDVTRTWIYLRSLLDDYDRFNEVRSAFHQQREIGTGSRLGAFPASTGIEGASDGERCVMDVLALELDGGAGLRPLLRSSRQDKAFDYGSGFSRGAALELEGATTVLVSGTASIGADGHSRHVDDAEAQALETLLAIAALLEPEGATLHDVALGTLFVKNTEAAEAFARVTRLLQLPPLPLVPVLADVCRPELLVEIEAVALVPRGRKRP